VGKLSLYAGIFTRLFYLLIQLVRAANYGRWCRWWLQSGPSKWPLSSSLCRCDILVKALPIIQPELVPAQRLGLPDLPYFTGAPVFQAVSPASRLKPIRETISPVFW